MKVIDLERCKLKEVDTKEGKRKRNRDRHAWAIEGGKIQEGRFQEEEQKEKPWKRDVGH